MSFNVDDDIVLLAVAFIAADTPEDDEPVKKKRKSPVVWQRPWLAHRDNPMCENVYTLMLRLRSDGDEVEFRRMTRMDFETYDYVLAIIEDDIRKSDTCMRVAIKPGIRLAVTLRYLAHEPRTDWFSVTQDELKEALKLRPTVGVAKNVILFMGDGMSFPNIMASRVYNAQSKDLSFREALLSFEKFPFTGLSRTYNTDRMVTDSAAAAGAYLRGEKVRSGTIGVNQDVVRGSCSMQMEPDKILKSVLHHSHDEDKWTGVVTTTRLTHASPAQTYGAAADRGWECDADQPDSERACKDLARQLVEEHDYIRVVLGGGRGKFTPNTMADPEYPDKMGERVDGRDFIKMWQDKKASDLSEDKYKFVRNLEEFNDAEEADLEYLWGMFEPGHMKYEVDRINRSLSNWEEPSLKEMTVKAINMLKKSKKGYFLFVEGGRIDHAHHAGNAFKALNDTIAFSEAVQAAVDMVDLKDTLVIVTADHSHAFTVGGLTPIDNPIFGLATTIIDGDQIETHIADDGLPFTILSYANGPSWSYHHTDGNGTIIKGRKNLTEDSNSRRLGHPEFLQEAPVPLVDETHGGEEVPIYATGPMAHLFHGSHEQTLIAHVMMYASCVGPNKKHCKNPEYDSWAAAYGGGVRGLGGLPAWAVGLSVLLSKLLKGL